MGSSGIDVADLLIPNQHYNQETMMMMIIMMMIIIIIIIVLIIIIIIIIITNFYSASIIEKNRPQWGKTKYDNLFIHCSCHYLDLQVRQVRDVLDRRYIY